MLRCDSVHLAHATHLRVLCFAYTSARGLDRFGGVTERMDDVTEGAALPTGRPMSDHLCDVIKSSISSMLADRKGTSPLPRAVVSHEDTREI
jgi:hypothetical protein